MLAGSLTWGRNGTRVLVAASRTAELREGMLIPEAYWQFIGRWWWLIMLFAIGGVAVALVMESNAEIAYRSVGVLEVDYVRRVNGNITLDESARAQEVRRKTVQLESAEVMAVLRESLATDGYTGSAVVDIGPPRDRRTSSPQFLHITVTAPDRAEAQWVAGKATELFARLMNEEYDLALDTHQKRQLQIAEQAAASLEVILQEKRNALAEETGVGSVAARQLISEHSRLLGELLQVLGQLRAETLALDRGDSSSVAELDQTLAELAGQVAELSVAWEQQLKVPLEILYNAESQPRYQLALTRQTVMSNQYREHVNTLTSLSNGESSSGVSIISKGSLAERIKVAALSTKYLLVGGLAGGAMIGWLLANVAEQIMQTRTRRQRRLASEEAQV